MALDPLEILRTPDPLAEPAPVFVATVRARLVDELSNMGAELWPVPPSGAGLADADSDPPAVEVYAMDEPARQRSPRRTIGLVGAAVAVAAAVVIALIVVSDFDSSDRPPTQPATTAPSPGQQAVDLAQRFVESRDAWNAEAVRSLLADGAVVDGAPWTADNDRKIELEHMIGWRFLQPQCTATVIGPPAEVTCTYKLENSWSRALGVGPFAGFSFEFVIADGQIQQVTGKEDANQFSPQVWEVFLAWVEDTHPDDVDVMYEFTPGGCACPRLTPESLALWARHTFEFVSTRSQPRAN
jgi:hypothetical protein